jgi:benzoate membrane transport protein
MGRQAHEDRSRGYVAPVAAGVFYIVVGLFGATVVAAFAALPKALIASIAGIALLGTIGNSLAMSVEKIEHREAALITFLVTASGVTFVSVGSAFWALMAGTTAFLFSRIKPSTASG